MENRHILEKITQSDMVLVGLGEEFDGARGLQRDEKYMDGREKLKEEGLHWLIPAWNEFCTPKEKRDGAGQALQKLAELLKDKNYFVVSVATNSEISRIPWKRTVLSGNGRLVMPCGSTLKKQCLRGCEEVLEEVTEEDRGRMESVLEALSADRLVKEEALCLGLCPKCGSPLTLHNIYADNYMESGYLEQWKFYTNWLQGTLNRRLLILELGVGMRFPSVIRWPFERIALYNQKAYICRVNESLYQMSAELAGKGCGISQNAIDWLSKL